MYQVTAKGPPATAPEIRQKIGPLVFQPEEVAANVAIELLAPQEMGTPRTLRGRITFGLELLQQEVTAIKQDTTTIHPGNGVMILGPGAAAKTTTAEYLKESLRYMEHRPTSELFGNKQYRARISPYSSDEEKAAVLWEEYIYASIRGAFTMQKKLETMPKPLSADFIAIGGLLQTLVGLCAFTKTYEIDKESGQISLPEPLFMLIIVNLKTWSPRFFVVMDSDKQTRVERAKAQAETSPVAWTKRQMVFEHDEIIRSLLISTLQRLQTFFLENPRPAEKSHFIDRKLPFHFLYFPTNSSVYSIPRGFRLIHTQLELQQYIQDHQNHRALEDYLARISDTLND
ncbi:MAG: hypothetical protein QY312_03255 [Candidatus Dojkabacteria bacterium]|nr:MAG: hypothetical protein QY312_03255 [Candidatus Dojkabacteria bacterium]